MLLVGYSFRIGFVLFGIKFTLIAESDVKKDTLWQQRKPKDPWSYFKLQVFLYLMYIRNSLCFQFFLAYGAYLCSIFLCIYQVNTEAHSSLIVEITSFSILVHIWILTNACKIHIMTKKFVKFCQLHLHLCLPLYSFNKPYL